MTGHHVQKGCRFRADDGVVLAENLDAQSRFPRVLHRDWASFVAPWDGYPNYTIFAAHRQNFRRPFAAVRQDKKGCLKRGTPKDTGDTIRCEVTVTRYERKESKAEIAAAVACFNQEGKKILEGSFEGIIRL